MSLGRSRKSGCSGLSQPEPIAITIVDSMNGPAFNLAIETSTRQGSIALGRDDELMTVCLLGAQHRHTVQLMPQVQALAAEHGFGPADLREVYLSIGPGSFTGLRIAVTLAKMLARVTGCRLVAVPTLDVVAANVPVDDRTLAVCLNAKGGRCFTELYQAVDSQWQPRGEAQLLTPPQVCQQAGEEVVIAGDEAVLAMDWPGQVTRLDAALSQPVAQWVWRLGRSAAAAGRSVDPYQLAPLYVRLPDAEEKWRQNRATSDES